MFPGVLSVRLKVEADEDESNLPFKTVIYIMTSLRYGKEKRRARESFFFFPAFRHYLYSTLLTEKGVSLFFRLVYHSR